MASASLALRGVGFAYPSAPDPILHDLDVHFPTGFTGVVGPNGSGKTTLLQLAVGVLSPDAGSIDGPADAIYCAQRTDDPPHELASLLDDTDGHVHVLRDKLGIEDDWADRWTTLSHGERKRAQIGCALWRPPRVLAIDEPTNHLDTDARDRLLRALEAYRGVGLIVSHDRDLLDGLCSQCLWLDGPETCLRPGGYTALQATRAVEAETAQRVRQKAVKQRDAIRREQSRRRQQAQAASRARSKRGIARKDHAAKAEIDARRVADSGEGQRLRQIHGHVARAEGAVREARVEKVYRIGIQLPGTPCRRDTLFRIPAGELALGTDRRVRFPDLIMRPTDRIAVTGANGRGKSTLIEHLRTHLDVEEEHLLHIPQEITAARGTEILAQVKALPRAERGHAMTVVRALGSDPAALLQSRRPSPGEVRKLLLALGMTRNPQLLIMDEPTNHLDLPSVEALEAALSECTMGMVLVSHDTRFLDALATVRWTIGEEGRVRVE